MSRIEGNSGAGPTAAAETTSEASSGIPTNSESAELLPEPSFGGDPLFELQALMAEMQLEDKSHAREARHAEEQAADAALERSIEAMEEQADQLMWSGIFSGVGTVAGGVASGLGGSDVGGGILKDRGTSAWVRMGGKGVEGGFGIMSAIDQADAKRAEGDVKTADADNEAAIRASQDAQTAAEDAQDAMRTTLQRLEQILQAEEEARLAAAGGGVRG